MRIVFLLLFIGLRGATWGAAPTPESSKQAASANSPWGRIVMVGASATAGFTISEMLGGTNTPRLRLSRDVDAALRVPHDPVRNLAHPMFFMQADATGQQQIEEAIAVPPTLVLGVDFLFWFCYGEGRTDAERLRRLEQGLKLLEVLPCPLVLGDLPDASAAVGGILRADQLPSTAARAAANLRLHQWAAARPRVVIVALSAFMRTIMANEAITIHGQTIPPGKTRLLLQEDKLHPSPPGAAVLALALLDAFHSAHSGRSDREIRWDAKEVFRLGSQFTPGRRTIP